MNRYPSALRPAIADLAGHHQHLADLVYSFPAAIVSIAARQGAPAARGEAVYQARNGAPLAGIAEALELPIWLRRVPPEGFLVPPPLLEVSAETERHFGRRVLNHKPLDPGAAGPWLAWISRARALQGDAFAAWVARLPLFQSAPRGLVWNRVPSLEGLELLAAFAWHSSAGKGAARSAVGRPWSEATTLRTAVEEIQDWVQRIFQIYCPASVEDGSPWHESRTVSGYEFVPLLTGPDLRMEASRMDNCLDRYPRRVRAGMCMIYSIRKDGRSVADLEVRPSGRHRSQPVIAHILGPSNHAVTRTVRAAAETWLAGQTTALMIGRRSSEVIDPEEWAACWRLYREAVPQSGLFAEEDHIAQSYAIQTAAAQLSIIARTGVVTL